MRDRGETVVLHTEQNCSAQRARVVVFSDATLDGADWLASVDLHQDGRLVPVRYEDVTGSESRMPKSISQLNWLAAVRIRGVWWRIFRRLFPRRLSPAQLTTTRT